MRNNKILQLVLQGQQLTQVKLQVYDDFFDNYLVVWNK